MRNSNLNLFGGNSLICSSPHTKWRVEYKSSVVTPMSMIYVSGSRVPGCKRTEIRSCSRLPSSTSHISPPRGVGADSAGQGHTALTRLRNFRISIARGLHENSRGIVAGGEKGRCWDEFGEPQQDQPPHIRPTSFSQIRSESCSWSKVQEARTGFCLPGLPCQPGSRRGDYARQLG